MNSRLREYFPTIRTREQVLQDIEDNITLKEIFKSWELETQEEFLDFCTGVKGVKVLYDAFFKEIMNPEYAPERLSDLLSVLMNRNVKVLNVIPTDSTRIANETSLLIMDIVVELEDGTITNVEVQKIGYAFPGQRSACYSADLLLRQYRRVRSEKKKKEFRFKDIKPVYTIILFESSPKVFKDYPNTYMHSFSQVSNTGLELDLLQHYIFIVLDIFKSTMHNNINNKLEAWLTFLCQDDPEWIIKLLEQYPEYKALYEDAYNVCLNTERVMEVFSKELLEMDRNTVMYMIDEMQNEISQLNQDNEKKNEQLQEKNEQLQEKNEQLQRKDQELRLKDEKLKCLEKQMAMVMAQLEEMKR